MLVDPDVLQRLRPTPDVAELHLHVSESLSYFADHFPVHPLLPGVVQLGWAVRVAQQEFAIAAPFAGVTQLKFQHPISPGDEVTLRLQRAAPDRVDFSFAAPGTVCSSGRLRFAHEI